MSSLQKFIFEGLPVRGIVVRLDESWQEVLRRRSHQREWPAQVQSLMGQMAAASLLMHSTIKFNGALVFQISGDGPLKLAVAEAQASGTFRVTAKLQGDIPQEANLQNLCNQRAQGRCAITLDPKDRLPGQRPYQGVVGLQLEGASNDKEADLAAVLEQYMRQSEQLDTKIVLAANGSVAAGLLIQRLPVEGEHNLEGQGTRDDEQEDAFDRIAILAASLKEQELLTLSPDTILHRLFWQESLQLFDVQTPQFQCTCSRARVGDMIVSLGAAEAESILAEQGSIGVDCDFCGAHYAFDAIEAAQLFTPAPDRDAGSTSVH